MNFAQTKRPSIRSILETVARSRAIDPEEVLGPCRADELMAVRKEVAFKAVEVGHARSVIAVALHRDYATISHYLNPARQKRNYLRRKHAPVT